MTDKFDQRQNDHSQSATNSSAELLPLNLEATHEQLTQEGEEWAQQLPEAETLARYARALPGTSSRENLDYTYRKSDSEEDR